MDARSPSPRRPPDRSGPRAAALAACLAVLAFAVPAAPRPGAIPGAKAKAPAAATRRAPAGSATRAPAKAATARKDGATKPRAARAGARKTPAPEPPPPDPLAGAWPSRDAPQTGDGTLDSEILVAARRLLGLQGSFDEDSFLRHLAYVMDLARKSDRADDAWAESLAVRAAARGALKKDARARPGDLALFSLDPGRPRSPQARRVLVGVVESSGDGVVRFIAPVGDEVRRAVARPGGKGVDQDTILRECRAPEPPPPPPSKKKTKKKTPKKRPKPLPCRAGELWIGRVQASALPGLF